MSIKKYSSGSWVTIPYRKYETATDTITSLPKTIIGDGQPISAYTIKGNMLQSGTPTPTSPIYPQECGDLVTTGEHVGQYGIPISFGQGTHTNYLSEPIRKIGDDVDSMGSIGTVTRNIKKLAFTGEENWQKSQTIQGWFYVLNLVSIKPDTEALCTDYVYYPTSYSQSGTLPNGGFAYDQLRYGAYEAIAIVNTDYNTETAFKSYLAERYASDNPVAIYYVLKTSTTETFTAPSIPTSGTAQSFDVDTTLKPSEVSLTYHGWHEHSDTKYT